MKPNMFYFPYIDQDLYKGDKEFYKWFNIFRTKDGIHDMSSSASRYRINISRDLNCSYSDFYET